MACETQVGISQILAKAPQEEEEGALGGIFLWDWGGLRYVRDELRTGGQLGTDWPVLQELFQIDQETFHASLQRYQDHLQRWYAIHAPRSVAVDLKVVASYTGEYTEPF
jgi:hypothetical protein